MHPYEQRLAIEIAERLLIAIRKQSAKNARTFSQFFAEQCESVGLALDLPDESDGWEAPDQPGFLDECRAAVRKRLAELADAKPGDLARRLVLVARVFGLSDDERDILGLIYRVQFDEVFEELFDRCHTAIPWDDKRIHRVAAALGMTRRRVAEALDEDGRLVRCGLAVANQRAEPTDTAADILKAPELNETSLVRRILGKRLEAELEWSDFDHMAQERDRITAMLRSAYDRKEKAIHVLLYGAPGSGKSQLARTIVDRLGIPLHPVGEANGDGEEMNRKERLSAYRMTQMLSAGLKACALVVDEADDILGGTPWSALGREIRTAGSKAHLHKLLESTGTPTIWTTNAEDWIDPAIMRRMTYVVEVRRPRPDSLARLWTRVSGRHKVDMTPAQATKLANDYPVAPGLVTGAIRLAELTGGGYEDLEAGVAAFSKAMGLDQERASQHAQLVPFEPDLTVADTDLITLCARLATAGTPAVSFCLYGPPGTGKTAFARFLAEALKLRFVQKRASDLADKYLGETEKRIAAAFREAREEGALLMFDEADSFLQDRNTAVRNWEVTQVNEMLTWMEDHPLPFICATNLMDRLDPAALRRFVFKIRFEWLDRERARTAFRRFFALEPPPTLAGIERLAPGDFQVVARKARAMGWLDDANRLVAMLAEEEAAKPGAKNALGFTGSRPS